MYENTIIECKYVLYIYLILAYLLYENLDHYMAGIHHQSALSIIKPMKKSLYPVILPYVQIYIIGVQPSRGEGGNKAIWWGGGQRFVD